MINNLRFLPLEERIVLDAAIIASLMSDTAPLAYDRAGDLADFLNPEAPAVDSSDGVHLMLVSSAIDDLNTFVNASNVETIVYDAQNASLTDILTAVSAKLNGRLADSIAFANHGQAERFNLTNSMVVDSASLSDAAMKQFWGSVGSLVKDGGRVDLLSCNLSQFSSNVADTIDALLDSSGKNIFVAASSDLSGNASDAAASDWILEKGGIDASYYFDAGKISRWHDSLATFTVISQADSGAGTLRQAITDANLAPGTDTITFNITGTPDFINGGQNGYTIKPLTALPTLIDQTIIDGYSQAGSAIGTASTSALLLIEIKGGSAPAGTSGLTLSGSGSSGSEVHGLVINSFSSNGISITNGSGSNWISGNIIGLDISGTVALGNFYHGISIQTANNIIGGSGTGEGNVISGNEYGIVILGGVGSNVILGNIIGLDITGTSDRGNSRDGIYIQDSNNNIIGGGASGQGNVISGNNDRGIVTVSTATNNIIKGNIIGLNRFGTVIIGNNSIGVSLNSPNNILGGSEPGERNIISGNGTGIFLANAGNIVKGNIIGLNISGTVALGNFYHGISIQTANNIIGGSGVGEGNVISGNEYGIVILGGAGSNVILGNIIGLDITGTSDRGNSRDGIYIQDSNNNIIGGGATGQGNIISGNNGRGIVTVSTATNNIIKGNIIGLNLFGTAIIGNNSIGVSLNSNNNILGGNAAGERNIISGNGTGVTIPGTGNIVKGNIIGLDKTGTIDLGNVTYGIEILAGNNIIGGALPGEGNIISGNNNIGIFITREVAKNNIVKGNIIGLDISGTVILGNSVDGILIQSANNIIGGSGAGEGNILSGNLRHGLLIQFGGGGNLVLGNIIGLDISGTLDRGNRADGIFIQGSNNNLIGGSAFGEGNIISGNDDRGIVTSTNAQNNLIRGNIIGLNISGTAIVKNNVIGVSLNSSNNILGGNAPGEGNIISGNGTGIFILVSGNIVKGNIIGLDKTGTIDLGNTTSGIEIVSSNNIVGGILAGEGNVISGNNGAGIFLNNVSATNNLIKGNIIGLDKTGTLAVGNTNQGILIISGANNNLISMNHIFGNGSLGIDLGTSGVSLNDSGDNDGIQNFPILSSASYSEGMVTFTGKLNAQPGTYTLEFFANPTPDATGYGEGKFYLGSQAITVTSASVDTFFSFTFAPLATPLPSYTYSATATSSSGSTSEFSNFDAGAAFPNLSVDPNAAGNENTAISLNIAASLIDLDGSETLVIDIMGVPLGAILSAGTNLGGGHWKLNTEHLAGLTITPALNSSTDFTLTVKATSTEANNDTASVTQSIFVDLNALANAPNLIVDASAAGNENTAIPLNITASLNDLDGSETLVIDITGVPSGASLSAGTNLGGGHWQLNSENLTGLTITPALNSSTDFTLTVKATSTEANNDTASVIQSISVDVNAVANAPNLAVAASSSGNENTAIPLNIAASLNDVDGSESLVIDITGVPTGATLSAGINLGGGHWQLSSEDLVGLTITPALNSGNDFNLTVKATSTESSNNAIASVTQSIFIDLTAVANVPNLAVDASAAGKENAAIPLNIAASLNDIDGSESLVIDITGVPSGASLSAGVNLGGGHWQLSSEELAGLTITPAANSNTDFTLTVKATSTEANNDTASVTQSIFVDLNAVANAPNLTVVNAIGNEDTAIPLNISSSLVDSDGSEALAIHIGNVPAGALLTAGINLGGGNWLLTPAQLNGLKLIPALHYANDFTLTVKAISTENSNNSTASVTKFLGVKINAVADLPNLTVINAIGNEDTAIPLNISSSLVDTDGSEALTIHISNVPSGALLTAGINLGGGNWLLTPAQLNGLKIIPALHNANDFTLTVKAISTESNNNATASVTKLLAVKVNAVADLPTLTVADAVGLDNVPIPLNISSLLVDRDGSESLTIRISGVPIGAVLSNGFVNAGGGIWVRTGITPGTDMTALNGLTIKTPLTFDGPLTLQVFVKSIEAENGSIASRSTNLNVFVKPRLWGIDRADNQLFSIGDYTNAAATFKDYGVLKVNGIAIKGSIESFALQGTKGYFVINSYNAPGSTLHGRDVLGMVDITRMVVGGSNNVTLLGLVNVPIGQAITGLAINPLSGDLYAIQKRANSTGAGQDSLIIISKTDGRVLKYIGMITKPGKSSITEDLKFDKFGNLFVTDNYTDQTYKISTQNASILSVVDNNQNGGMGAPVHFTAMAYDAYTNTMIALDDNEDVLAYGITGDNGQNRPFADLTTLGLTSIGGMDFSQ
ncbi:MAG: DUF4347 domain-containing protein [Candidatus Protochlamydia sp.]|nr:DUF4347 domain-containing protein [Candidatus Protochlamydia sp.]